MAGFDMGPTLAWYEDHLVDLSGRLPAPKRKCPSGVKIEIAANPEVPQFLSLPDIYGVLKRFPHSARRRMTLGGVAMTGARWFHRDSTAARPDLTEHREEALSETAIIPSMITFPTDPESWWQHSGIISLFAIQQEVASPGVRRLVHLQGLAHELAHAFVTAELYEDCQLRFPEASAPVSAAHFFAELYDAINGCPPISHYASAYTGAGGQLIPHEEAGLTPLNEAICECIAAQVLGFAFRLDGTGLDPFQGRWHLRQMVEAYLRAERVNP